MASPTSPPVSTEPSEHPPLTESTPQAPPLPLPTSLEATPTQPRHLTNRIVYLGLLSFLGPLLNIVYNWKQVISMGMTLGLMEWILFGILWCGGFTTIMGPFFAICASLLRFLDIVPALGSTLWVVLSTIIMVACIADPFPAFLHNLPLFSLIFANALIFSAELSQDHAFWALGSISSSSSSPFRPLSPSYIFPRPTYYWHEGHCCYRYENSAPSVDPFFILTPLSLPDGAVQAFEALRNSGFEYINGLHLNRFAADFGAWKAHTLKFSSAVALRRAFCLVGFLLEAAAVVCIVALLGTISGSGSNSFFAKASADPESTPVASVEAVSAPLVVSARQASFFMSPLDFSLLQFATCVVLMSFSDYLHTIIWMRRSFSTMPEVRAAMLRCLSSRIFDWTSPRSGYLANGQRIRGPGPLFYSEDEAMPVAELPTLGIIQDRRESEQAGNTILRSTVPSKFLCLFRVEESVVVARLYNPGSDRELLLRDGTEKVDLQPGDIVI